VTPEKGKSTGGFCYGSCWMIPPSRPRPDILPPLPLLAMRSPQEPLAHPEAGGRGKAVTSVGFGDFCCSILLPERKDVDPKVDAPNRISV
jgi:hypothetical protein